MHYLCFTTFYYFTASNQEHSEENQLKVEDFTVKCHNNLAAALIKLSNWKDALQACLVAEKLDGKNIKTLFRKGTVSLAVEYNTKGNRVSNNFAYALEDVLSLLGNKTSHK